MVKIISRILMKIQNGIEKIGVLLLGVLCVLASLQIAFRYLPLNITAAWTQELSRYVFVIMVAITIPYVMRTGENISMRPLIKKYYEKRHDSLIAISNIFVIVLCALIAISAFVVSQRTVGTSLSTVSWLRVGYAHIIIGIAFVFGLIFAVEETINTYYLDKGDAVDTQIEPSTNNTELDANPLMEGEDNE